MSIFKYTLVLDSFSLGFFVYQYYHHLIIIIVFVVVVFFLYFLSEKWTWVFGIST